jgi:hypothetical protein
MKKRTMNELRQTKEYKLSDQGGTYTVPYKGADPIQQVLAQQIDEEMDPSKYDGDINKWSREEQMQEIAEIVVPTIHDVIFNEIIEVMDNYDELNWGYFIQDDAPTALIDACMDHKTEIHYEIFQLVLQKLK